MDIEALRAATVAFRDERRWHRRKNHPGAALFTANGRVAFPATPGA
jgi:hypothetical protein